MQKVRRHAEALRPLVGTRFQVLFPPLPGCFSPFPHGTSSLSVTRVLSLGGWSPRVQTAFHGSGPTQELDRRASVLSPTGRLPSVVRGSTRLRLGPGFGNCRRIGHDPDTSSPDPRHATRVRLHMPGLGSPFRSPLLGESRLISFPRVLRCVSSLACLPAPMYSALNDAALPASGLPFGDPRVNACSATHRGLSQPSTSFFGSWCQGIHRVPLLS